MASNVKHVGRVANTGMKCVVVFREIYDDRGNVTEPNNCLVVETERLPDMEHDDVVRVVESPAGQQASQFYEIAHRSMFGDGINMLVKLNNRGYLKKYSTDEIIMTPNTHTNIKLSEINEVIRKQKSGMSQDEITNSMVDDTDQPPRTQSSSQNTPSAPTAEADVLDDIAIAKTMLSQAETYELEVKRLREEAYAMAPALKPKRGRPSKKVTADANS